LVLASVYGFYEMVVHGDGEGRHRQVRHRLAVRR